jgi:hypothetical protein
LRLAVATEFCDGIGGLNGLAVEAALGLDCLGFFASRFPRRVFMDMGCCFPASVSGKSANRRAVDEPYTVPTRSSDIVALAIFAGPGRALSGATP